MSDQPAIPAFDENQIHSPVARDFVRSIADPERQTVVACSIIKHSRPDKLAVGDPVPALDLTCLDGVETMKTVNLAAITERPLVLFFGSYT